MYSNCTNISSGVPALLQIFEWVKEHGGEPIIPFSGIMEAKIFDMPDDEKATYLKEVMLLPSLAHGVQHHRASGCQPCALDSMPGPKPPCWGWLVQIQMLRKFSTFRRAVSVQNEAVSALPKIITTGFKAIQLIYFFTAGEDEVKCWQIRKNTKAPQVLLFLQRWVSMICNPQE